MAETGEVQILAVPGVPSVLDGGVPWPRTGAELDREWTRMIAAVDARAAVRRGAEDLDGNDRAMLGLYQAARWTVGDLAIAPMSGRRLPVTGRMLTDELNRAERDATCGGFGAAYGTGVLAWLMWLVGEREHVHHPHWDADDPRRQF